MTLALDLPPEIAAAYFFGFKTKGDPDVLADIGIPTDPADAYSDYRSGQIVAELTSTSNAALARAAIKA